MSHMDEVVWALDDVKARLPGYGLVQAYDRGNHRLLFATEKYRNTFGDLFREFADNLCDDVLDSMVNRIQIMGWSSEDTALAQQVTDWWTTVKGEARASTVHRNALREGDGFAMLQQNPQGQVRLFRQHPAQMAVQYDTEDPDVLAVAAKVWRDGKRYRLNVIHPDRTERYASRGLSAGGGMPGPKAFVPLEPGDPDLVKAGLESYVDPDSTLADVFHFPSGTVSEYGESLLRDVIPLQDALNKAVADMLVAMEFAAYPQRWATGVQVERDPVTGKELSPFQAGEGRVWRVGSKDAEFGQFDPAAMEGFLQVQASFRAEIARKGKMPLHAAAMQQGTPPTGVALLVAEGETVKFGKDRTRDWGTEWRRLGARAMSLTLATQVDPEDLDMEWAPVETRDEQALLEGLLIKRDLQVPTERLLVEAGYDPEDAAKWAGEAMLEAEADALAADTLVGGRIPGPRSVNRALGVLPGPVPPTGTPMASA